MTDDGIPENSHTAARRRGYAEAAVPKRKGVLSPPRMDGRHLPAKARAKLYESFQAHTDEVREMLIGIVRDDTADNGHRIQAGKEILSRGWGQAPNVEIIEATFKHQHTFNPDALRQMSAQQLAAAEAALTMLMRIPDAEVLDVTPNESSDHALSGRRTGESDDDDT